MRFQAELKYIELPKWGKYLRGQWEEQFAAHLSPKKKKEIYLQSYLWHLCSYEETAFLSGEAAVAAFEKQPKEKCTIFFELHDDAYLIENAVNLQAADLLLASGEDVYVMDWSGQWTFMNTHEKNLGPYFIERKKNP
ncbi:DUF4275 family protein [Planococcus liqunii]|uniref:DUF4275 family protein n=1 Tax=Planococcus liqunii TaxID=3058394 RepID=A0ABT8MTE1_9BACL|nr:MULTISPECIES: DUF4275 family protein [unclassified Planococcus (in: firmicutes)]MDN7228121.1 DUF4275 family protein [Planococcus sp. N064]WKA49296.1 DUF4275 family protein [Planococcus sp. N056]